MVQIPELQVGVIGTGRFAQACHIPGVQSHPGATLAAICGRSVEAARTLAEQHHIARSYSDYRALCADPAIDAVIIATPNAVHAEQAICALEHGKHVLCEKPIALTVTDSERVLAAAQASGKVHMMAFTYRYCYGVQELRRQIRRGVVGVPRYLRVQFDSWQGADPARPHDWRDVQATSGGGLLFDRGPHMFDVAQFLLGPIEWVTGFALAHTPAETDAMAGAWFRFGSGAKGQWFASHISPPFAPNLFVQVVGDQAALQAAVSRGTVDSLHLSQPGHEPWSPLPLPDAASDQLPHALPRMVHSFIDACRRGAVDTEADATFEDGVAAQRAIDAVVLGSADRPVWVRLPH